MFHVELFVAVFVTVLLVWKLDHFGALGLK